MKTIRLKKVIHTSAKGSGEYYQTDDGEVVFCQKLERVLGINRQENGTVIEVCIEGIYIVDARRNLLKGGE
jgi:hypothetical protein